jgi:hypothetical protein
VHGRPAINSLNRLNIGTYKSYLIVVKISLIYNLKIMSEIENN